MCQQAFDAVKATGDKNTIPARCNRRRGTWDVRGILKPGKLSIIEKKLKLITSRS